MIKAVIFDVDGTLVDSVDIHAKAWQDAFRDFGHQIEFLDIRHQIGKGGDQLMPVFVPRKELEARGHELDQHRSRLFKAHYLDRIQPFPRVRELFARLRADGIQIALASSGKEDEIRTHQKRLNIEDLLDVQTTSDDAERSKPYPDIFQAAFGRLEGVQKDEAVVIGDTPYDAQAALAAGLRPVGVLCGGFPESELREAGCTAIFRDPADLLERYDELVQAGAKHSG